MQWFIALPDYLAKFEHFSAGVALIVIVVASGVDGLHDLVVELTGRIKSYLRISWDVVQVAAVGFVGYDYFPIIWRSAVGQ